MLSSSTLLDYLTAADIVVFLGVPLCLLTIVLAQQFLTGRTIVSFSGSYSKRSARSSITKALKPSSRSFPSRATPRK